MSTPWSEPAAAILAGGVVAGVLSGTSADGIDVGLMRFARGAKRPGRSGTPALPGLPALTALTAPEPVAFETVPFEPGLGARLRAVLDGGRPDLGELARLDRDLGRALGRAARAVAERRGVALALVGSHGQTVWHHDGEARPGLGESSGEGSGPDRATLQLGSADELAEAAGCAVAADFRRRDVAAGGEGAPLSALVDPLLFGALERPYAVLNLGGIANLTVVAADGRVSAFDTGPAGSLLDGLARRLLGRPFDAGGEAALAGRAAWAAASARWDRWAEELLAHPFYARPAPKSTGRDTFGAAWVDGLLRRPPFGPGHAPADPGPEQALAGAVDFVARHVALGLRQAAGEPLPLVVAGGGVHNRALMDALDRRHPGPVRSSADHGVHPDGREALVFGVLGARCALGVPSTDPGVTGAARGRVLGHLVLPPPTAEA